MVTNKEMQQIIDDMVAGSDCLGPQKWKTLVIHRQSTVYQTWEIDVLIPENYDFQQDCISQILCDGCEFGEPTNEEYCNAEDEAEIK